MVVVFVCMTDRLDLSYNLSEVAFLWYNTCLPHVDPVPFPPDPATVMLSFVMLIGVIVVLVFGITTNVFVADPYLPSADACTSTLNFPGVASPLILHRCEYMP